MIVATCEFSRIFFNIFKKKVKKIRINVFSYYFLLKKLWKRKKISLLCSSFLFLFYVILEQNQHVAMYTVSLAPRRAPLSAHY